MGRGSPLYRYECRAAQGRQSRQARAEETEELGKRVVPGLAVVLVVPVRAGSARAAPHNS